MSLATRQETTYGDAIRHLTKRNDGLERETWYGGFRDDPSLTDDSKYVKLQLLIVQPPPPI